MKHILVTLFVTCIGIAHSYGQDLIGLSSDKTQTDGRKDCVTTLFNIPVPFLRSDCQDANQPKIDITYRFRECFGMIEGQFCDFSYGEIILNGVVITTIPYNETSTNFNETLTTDQYAHIISDTDEACFTLKVYKECTLTGTSEIYSATQCVPVLKEGDLFSRVEYTGPVRRETLACQSDQKLTVCCEDPPITISSDLSLELSSTQSNTIDISFFDFSVGSDLFEISSPIKYTSSTTLAANLSEGTTINRQLTINPEPGVCKSVALNLNILDERTYFYKVGTCDDDPLPYMSQVTGEALFSVTFKECVVFICPDQRPALAFESQIATYKRNSCMGDILATIPSDYEGELSFEWTGPYGFSSAMQNLVNVPFGLYELVVTDDCCNAYPYTFFLCDDAEYGAWERQEDELQFCRILRCNSENCEVEDTQQCVEPDEVIESYENGTCIERYYFEGDFLGEANQETEIKIDFNADTQRCIKIAKCLQGEYIIDETAPTYGSWEFNYGIEECLRMVFCFDQQVQGAIDSKKPEIEEVFDLITGLCHRTAYCDMGIPIILSPKPPIISNPWQWSEFQGCSKYVQCSPESGAETISGSESFTNWSYNTITNQCESEVSCENIWVPSATHTEFPTSTGSWNWSSNRPLQEQCYRTVLCGGVHNIEHTVQPTYQTTGIPCGDGLFQYYIICDGVNTFEIGCGSIQAIDSTGVTREALHTYEGKDVRVYPNPFTDVIYFEGLEQKQKYQVEVNDKAGRLIYKQEIKNASLDLSELAQGIYFIRIKENHKSIGIHKIIKN